MSSLDCERPKVGEEVVRTSRSVKEALSTNGYGARWPAQRRFEGTRLMLVRNKSPDQPPNPLCVRMELNLFDYRARFTPLRFRQD